MRKALAGAANIHVIIVFWAIVVNVGFTALFVYSALPGADASAPATWPVSSRIARDPSCPTLLVFAHPRCSCTGATLEELAGLMARFGDRVSASVVFLEPVIADPAWGAQSANWRMEAAIPGVKIVADAAGVETRRFGARTSGCVMLFDADGHRLFQGGITASRGELGPNAGSEAVAALLEKTPALLAQTPAFGCPLFAAERADK